MNHRNKLTGPWRIIQVAIWLLGLTILYWQDDWYWPGILVLFGSDIILSKLRKVVHKEALHES